jgi:nitronate monooxygenase
VAEATDKPWGVGFQTWALDNDKLHRALDHKPMAVMLSFGDPSPFAEVVRSRGAVLIIQVTDLEEARQALAVGADLIVAQGAEAGGHGGKRATLPFVPVVVDLAAPVPVLAAGGIADGRGLAASLVLGAAGALIGTRFQASLEALVAPVVTKAIVEGTGEDTERSRVFDIASGSSWPERYTARTLMNPFMERWRDRERELAGDPAVQRAYEEMAKRRDPSAVPVYASEAIDLITDLIPARDLVGILAAQAEQALARAGR